MVKLWIKPENLPSRSHNHCPPWLYSHKDLCDSFKGWVNWVQMGLPSNSSLNGGDLVNENYLKVSLLARTPIWPVLSAVSTSVRYCWWQSIYWQQISEATAKISPLIQQLPAKMNISDSHFAYFHHFFEGDLVWEKKKNYISDNNSLMLQYHANPRLVFKNSVVSR